MEEAYNKVKSKFYKMMNIASITGFYIGRVIFRIIPVKIPERSGVQRGRGEAEEVEKSLIIVTTSEEQKI